MIGNNYILKYHQRESTTQSNGGGLTDLYIDIHASLVKLEIIYIYSLMISDLVQLVAFLVMVY